ncbi:MAG TPA: MarR family transcriptional regulator [Terriglobales bacterium]|nr:MarR family transcriptional regulator [Terriglobales bacterium]
MKAASKSASKARMITEAEYRTLAEFRYQLTGFLRRRRNAARSAGLEPQQYELLLAVKGLPKDKQPTIKQIADQLQLQHHSAVELTTRLVNRGLVKRQRSQKDRRSVLLSITHEGERAIEQVVKYSLAQLRNEAPELLRILGRLLRRAPRTR